ncbi:MAG: selenocysteine-specific translation elongation factor [Anaerolineaceae bacterium]
MRVIGTAGHVDHGKSSLVKALTGTNPDRLKEELAREMTIELGFAWFTLPNGEEVGIVDVPGHRDFIGNMLAGIGSIDAVLLIIAADEGVMPQTREHLAIIDLLQIDAGIVVMTKTDLITDPDWLDLVELDIHEALKNTTMEHASVVRVSSVSGDGLDILIEEILRMLERKKKKADLGKPRLSVDRVFSLSGFGTIVTGTLLDGTFQVGDEVIVFPKTTKSRIRGIQTHKHKTDFAGPGTRTAINLTGIDVNEIERGDVVTSPGKYSTTKRFDAYVTILPESISSLKHNEDVKIFIGTKEVLSRARVLGSDGIEPGNKGWVQFETNSPLIISRTDRFIIRRPSPAETIGGGEVVNPFPEVRHKRFDKKVIQKLEAYYIGTPEEILSQAIFDLEVATFDEIVKKARVEQNLANEILPRLLTSGVVIHIATSIGHKEEDAIYGSLGWYANTVALTKNICEKYHEQYPLRSGIPREELRRKLRISSNIFLFLLEKWDQEKTFCITKSNLALNNHKVVFSKTEKQKIDSLLEIFQKNPYSTPGVKDCINALGEELFSALLDQEIFVQVSNEIVFTKLVYEEMLSQVINNIELKGEMSVAQFRDLFQTSRKYALGFLEKMDSIGVTFRDGDTRRLLQRRNSQ